MIAFLAALGVLFIAIIVATAVILWVASISHPAAVDEWDGVNDPLDDGTWTAGDTEVVNEAGRFRRGGNPE